MKNFRYFFFIIPFIAFFTTVNIIFTYIAESTHSGNVQSNSYKIGQKYNKILQHHQKQQNLPFDVIIDLKQNQDNPLDALVDIYIDSDDNFALEGKILRPVTDKFDQALNFKQHNRHHTAVVTLESLGLWEVLIRINYQDEYYFFEKRFFLQ